MRRPQDIDRANLIARGYSLGSDVVLFPLSSKVALIGRATAMKTSSNWESIASRVSTATS
jgi:hypothetical protein